MAWMQIAVCLAMALCAAADLMYCPPSDRISWIPEAKDADPGGIYVGEPWTDYELPENKCCYKIDPETEFNAQEKCSLCYNLTKSTPGFAADPNNCQNFYMCEPAGGPDQWNTFLMTCPNCTFWDQDKLTCVQVYDDPDDTGVCGTFVAVTPTASVPTPVPEDPKLFCINFTSPYVLADNGVYVYNDGVELVNDNSVCPIPDSQCGHFLGQDSRLEVPFFSNNYDQYKELVITFYYRRPFTGMNEQGIISNDCYPGATVEGAAGNSLYCSVQGDMFRAGMKEPTADVAGYDGGGNTVGFAKIMWTDQFLSIELRAGGPSGTLLNSPSRVPFPGPIRNSHCSLVIGSFIKDAADSFFSGYMDDICFYKWDPKTPEIPEPQR